MEITIKLRIIASLTPASKESPFISEISILTITCDGEDYVLGFMQLDSRTSYKSLLNKAINELLDNMCAVCGRDLVDNKIDELIENGCCEVKV